MKRLTYILTLVLLAAGCTEVRLADDETVAPSFNVSIQLGTRAGSGSASDKPVVNSVRILAFAGTAGSEKCVLNQYNPFGFTLTEESDIWTVRMKSDMLLASNVTSYKLYAVLNETGYSLSESQTLSKALNDFDAQSTLSEFETLAGTQVLYNPQKVTDNEPALLIYAHKDIEFTDGFDAPLEVVFDAEGTGTVAPKRSMAQIIIDKITSEPIAGHTSGSNVPKIFVKSVSIENVPPTAGWGADGTLGSATAKSIQVGAANEETGCYDRRWEGSVYENVTVNATRKQTTSAKYWRTGETTVDAKDKQLKTSWSFTEPSSFAYHFEPDYSKLKPGDKDYEQKKAEQDAAAQKKAYQYAIAGKTTIDQKYENTNSVVALVNTHLPGQFTDELVINTNFTTNSIVEDSGSGLTVSPDYWTINLDEGYYVPENIATVESKATCIKVRLALAAPTLNIDEVTVEDLSSAPSQFITEPTEGFSYYLGGYKLTDAKIQYKSGKKKKDGTFEIVEKDKWVPIVFGDNAHIVYSDDHDYEVETPLKDDGNPDDNWYDTHNNFHVYVDGFDRVVDGQALVPITSTTNNAVFNWNIPAAYVDLTIPVSDDLSVRRNTRYTITLHIDDTTYAKLTTPSSVSTRGGIDSIGISATVKIEKMNDDED